MAVERPADDADDEEVGAGSAAKERAGVKKDVAKMMERAARERGERDDCGLETIGCNVPRGDRVSMKRR
ncbi:hypothetical protein [Chondromyces crocatus]|uniref:hypothetical protein n=1 Tax=Chondromyces crocatus TaxID=52 RepID=UPI00067B4631|nr:hypothetical protein [Chondromyces crocatus]